MTKEIIKPVTVFLTNEDIQKLYPYVNTGREYHVDVNSYELLDKIIELWFQTKGYDFWQNPYPEVTEMTLTKDKEVEFTYLPND